MLTIIGLVGGGVVAAIVIVKVLSAGRHKEAGRGAKNGADKVRAIDDAILKDPDNGNLYFEKYRVLMDSDINDSWIPPLTKAIELGHEEARKERVVLQIVGTFVVIDKYLAGKDYFKALELLDKDISVWADEKNNNDPRMAELLERLRTQRAAVVQLIEENRNMSGDAWKGLSDAYLRSKEYAKALHAIETAIQKDPQNGQLYYKKFIVLQMLDNAAREEWIEALKKAAAAQVELAEMLLKGVSFEGFDKALDAVDAAIKADPGNGDLYFLVANILYAMDVKPNTVWFAALLKAAELGSVKAVEMKNSIVNLFGAEQTAAAAPGNG